MIYRLRFCNKDGVEAMVDIQKGSSTPVIEAEGAERPFILSYNNDKGNKSGIFLSSSADIEIYETPEFNINNLKTSNETELSVTHYINNVVSWQGFIIPDFFSIEVRNNPVITMTASDRLGTLKNVTLSDLPSMISLRELAILCLNKTGLELPLRTMADFNNGTGVNDFFNSKILTQRLSDTKGRSISCYDILSSILTASNSFLVQRSGSWHIINKIQHEAGSGKLYTGATSFINWSDVIFNFSDISTGGRRTIIPVASTVGVFHEFGGSKTYPSNYDFKDGASGWTVNFPEEMEARFDNRNILGFDVIVSGGGYQPVYGTETNNPHMVVYGFRGPLNYVKSEDIVVPTGYGTDVEIKFDINASAPIWNFGSFQRMAVFAVKGTATKALVSGSFVPLNEVTESQYMNRINFEQGPIYVGELARVATESFGVSGKLSDAEGLDGYTIHIRLYSSDRAYATVINFATINFAPVGEMAKGNLYKTERTDNYTKDHDIDTSLFADYLTTGLNGYFYRYAIDDTSSLYNSSNELTSKWTAYNDTEQLPLLQHITRQRSRLFSVAHDLLSAEIEVNNFDPLAIFVACEKRYTVVSAQFDFFKSNLSVELEEVAFQNATVRDFIYSYFGDGESGIKSIGGISGGSGGGGTDGGLTPEQLEILSWWKKDPDRENTIFTEMNAYSKLELSAYGVGDGGGGGGSDYERLDTWASYDSSRAEWVLSAFLGNDLNTRVTAIDGRVTDLENSSGSGSVTSVGISVPTGLSVSNSPITSSGVIAISLQTGYSIPTTEKQGQWDTAYSNTHTHSNKTVLDDITSSLVSNWNTAFNNSHTHSNKTQLDLITQSNIDVLARLSIVNGNLQIDGNAYATGELSSYGAGTGGGGGGGIIETVYGYGNLGQTFNNANLTDTFNAYTINQINTRLVAVESGSALTVNTTGTGNAITSISKAGSVITANKDLTFSLSGHTHTISSITNLENTLNSKLETSIFNTHNNDNVRHITGAERTKWDGVVTDFGNLEIGGRNLVLDSKNIPEFLQSRPYTTIQSVNADDSVDGQSDGWRFNIQGRGEPANRLRAITVHTLLPNTQYTLSITVKENRGITLVVDTLLSNEEITIIPYETKRVSLTTMSSSSGLLQIRFLTSLANITASYIDISLWGLKIEKGNKPTDWSPAPEDQVSDWNTTDINSFSFIKNKPTTLSGYGITDAYTKAQVDTSLNTKVSKSGDTMTGNLIINGGVTSLTLERTGSYNSNMRFKGSVGEVYVGKGNGNNFAVGNRPDLGPSASQWLYVDANGVKAATFAASISVASPKVIFNAAGWSMEQVGNELQMKHNNVLKMRFTSTGSIVATEEITAFG